MEDILSSIKRIIAEDTDSQLAPPRARRVAAPVPAADDEDDVLELTDPVAVEPPPVRRGRRSEGETEVADVKVARAPTVPQGQAQGQGQGDAAIVSPQAADASRSALQQLSQLVVKPDTPGGDTLEGMVREMLRPMLKDWLDAQLPAIVERLVAEEIKRIARAG